MGTKPMLRNRPAKFVDKGVNIELTEEAALNANAR